MLKHIWPRDRPSLKVRVVVAIGLLFGAKVSKRKLYGLSSSIYLWSFSAPCMCHVQLMNVQVPFFFKYAVDYYNKLPPITTPEGTIITMGMALLLGCKSHLQKLCKHVQNT